MWEEYYSVLGELPDWLRKPVPFIVNALPFFQEHKVQLILDLGCGAGRNSIYLGKEGFDVIGVDVSRNALKKVKSWSKIEGIPNVAVLRSSVTHLPFVRRTFHVVISISVIHHAFNKNIEKAIDEIFKVLKKKGLFLANLLSTEDFRFGSGKRLEEGTYRVLDDFGEKQFEEIHHFFSRNEVFALFSDFKKISIEAIQAGKEEKCHKYWKVAVIR
ncbi:MAG: class I SAM-dependent methyltransferase [Candidatus Bathyarchaeota archaeon]|nr:MAG: class I SAM-dependent methyltransferase [Candidatus Bathyarchaeota archaeon]